MGTLYVDTLEPEGGTTTLTVGETGQNTVIGGNTIKLNTLKDAGGNTLFVSDGSGTLSSVNSGFGSGMVLLDTTTVTTAVASINFTSNITSTYGEYIFRFYNINPATDGGLFGFQANVDGGSGYNETITSTAFFARHTEADGSAQLGYLAASDQAQGTAYQDLSYDAQNNADDCMGGWLKVFNPSSTTFVKQWYAEVNELIRNGAGATANNFMAGYFNTTSAIDEFSFKMSSGNINAGTIKMFGIK